MSILKSGIAAVAIVTGLAATAVVPTQAAPGYSPGQRDKVIGAYCGKYANDSDCIDYRRGHWDDYRYNHFYSTHRSGLDSISSNLFGLGFAAVLGSALVNSIAPNNDRVVGYAGNSHEARCQARFRSYDIRTDTYVGFDGRTHACRL